MLVNTRSLLCWMQWTHRSLRFPPAESRDVTNFVLLVFLKSRRSNQKTFRAGHVGSQKQKCFAGNAGSIIKSVSEHIYGKRERRSQVAKRTTRALFVLRERTETGAICYVKDTISRGGGHWIEQRRELAHLYLAWTASFQKRVVTSGKLSSKRKKDFMQRRNCVPFLPKAAFLWHHFTESYTKIWSNVQNLCGSEAAFILADLTVIKAEWQTWAKIKQETTITLKNTQGKENRVKLN